MNTLWELLYDCLAVRVDMEHLSFPSEWENDGIHVELNESGHSIVIYKDTPCNKHGGGSYQITCDDEIGRPQTYEITPLFPHSTEK